MLSRLHPNFCIMTRLLIFLFASIITLQVSAQTFEGRITYQNTFKSKSPKVSDEQFRAMMGERQEYYIKGGDYKSVMKGGMIEWQLYRNKDNKLYNKTGMGDAIFWSDAGSNPDEVLKAEIHKAAAVILGYKCDELVLTCKSGIHKYYFASQLGVDPKLFARHKFGNWAFLMSKMQALPLKMIIDNKQFTVQNVAVEVKPMKLDAKFFELPAGVQVMKAPF